MVILINTSIYTVVSREKDMQHYYELFMSNLMSYVSYGEVINSPWPSD